MNILFVVPLERPTTTRAAQDAGDRDRCMSHSPREAQVAAQPKPRQTTLIWDFVTSALYPGHSGLFTDGLSISKDLLLMDDGQVGGWVSRGTGKDWKG